MRNKTAKNPKELKPLMKWQTGKFDLHANFDVDLPYPFLLLCRLMDVTPEIIVTDFMDNLSCASRNRLGRDEAKEKLKEYFLNHKYGQHHYREEDIIQIFKELDAIGMLFPKDASDKMLDLHTKWRDKYYNYFFKKWYRRPKRKS